MALATQPAGMLLDYEQFIEYQIKRTRSRIKGTEVLSACLVLATACLGGLFLEVVFDHLFGLPFWVRAATLGTGGFLALGFALKQIVRPLMTPVNGLYAAKAIEDANPSIHNSLMNYLDLRRHGHDVPTPFLAAVEAKAVNDLLAVDVATVVDLHRLSRTTYALLGVVLLVVLYAALTHRSLVDSIRRALLADVPRPTAVRLDNIKPGDQIDLSRVASGASVPFSVETEGAYPHHVVLHYRAPGEDEDSTLEFGPGRTPIEPWETALPDVRQSLDYHITAGDAVSQTYHLEVIPAPVKIEDVTFDSKPQSPAAAVAEVRAGAREEPTINFTAESRRRSSTHARLERLHHLLAHQNSQRAPLEPRQDGHAPTSTQTPNPSSPAARAEAQPAAPNTDSSQTPLQTAPHHGAEPGDKPQPPGVEVPNNPITRSAPTPDTNPATPSNEKGANPSASPRMPWTLPEGSEHITSNTPKTKSPGVSRSSPKPTSGKDQVRRDTTKPTPSPSGTEKGAVQDESPTSSDKIQPGESDSPPAHAHEPSRDPISHQPQRTNAAARPDPSKTTRSPANKNEPPPGGEPIPQPKLASKSETNNLRLKAEIQSKRPPGKPANPSKRPHNNNRQHDQEATQSVSLAQGETTQATPPAKPPSPRDNTEKTERPKADSQRAVQPKANSEEASEKSKAKRKGNSSPQTKEPKKSKQIQNPAGDTPQTPDAPTTSPKPSQPQSQSASQSPERDPGAKPGEPGPQQPPFPNAGLPGKTPPGLPSGNPGPAGEKPSEVPHENSTSPGTNPSRRPQEKKSSPPANAEPTPPRKKPASPSPVSPSSTRRQGQGTGSLSAGRTGPGNGLESKPGVSEGPNEGGGAVARDRAGTDGSSGKTGPTLTRASGERLQGENRAATPPKEAKAASRDGQLSLASAERPSQQTRALSVGPPTLDNQSITAHNRASAPPSGSALRAGQSRGPLGGATDNRTPTREGQDLPHPPTGGPVREDRSMPTPHARSPLAIAAETVAPSNLPRNRSEPLIRQLRALLNQDQVSPELLDAAGVTSKQELEQFVTALESAMLPKEEKVQPPPDREIEVSRVGSENLAPPHSLNSPDRNPKAHLGTTRSKGPSVKDKLRGNHEGNRFLVPPELRAGFHAYRAALSRSTPQAQ